MNDSNFLRLFETCPKRPLIWDPTNLNPITESLIIGNLSKSGCSFSSRWYLSSEIGSIAPLSKMVLTSSSKAGTHSWPWSLWTFTAISTTCSHRNRRHCVGFHWSWHHSWSPRSFSSTKHPTCWRAKPFQDLPLCLDPCIRAALSWPWCSSSSNSLRTDSSSPGTGGNISSNPSGRLRQPVCRCCRPRSRSRHWRCSCHRHETVTSWKKHQATQLGLITCLLLTAADLLFEQQRLNRR